MKAQFLWITCIYATFTISIFNSVPILLPDYKISLYSENLKLSTLVWLRPAYCLYEEWMVNAVDTSLAARKTSTISVLVQINDDNNTYVVPTIFKIPQCSPFFANPPGPGDYGYAAGPQVQTINDTRVQQILPGHAYRFRFVLKNAANEQMAYSNWSDPFRTLDLPPSPSEMKTTLQGRSGGMVVITVLLSIAMFILLVGLAIIFGTQQQR
ncbi:uncharacterized protein RCH25_008040 [Pelodytes ibericus]